MDVAFVVVSYNVRELLEGCLASIEAALAQGNAGVASVCVVDNASSDDSADMVRARFPQVHLIENDQNRGFAAANNQALRALGFGGRASSEALPRYVILLNPDTTLAPDSLADWLSEASRSPQAGVIGARLAYPDGSFQHSAFAFPTLAQIALDFFPLHHRLIHSRLNGRYPRRLYRAGGVFPVGHPLGAAMLLRREALADIGLLDEGFFIYAEEVDWCIRLRRAGWLALCAPQVLVTHHEAQSTRQFREEMLVALWKSRLRLFAKHYSPAFNWAARRLITLGLWKLRRDTRRESAAGLIDTETTRRRLAALDEIANMLQRPADAFIDDRGIM